MELMSDCRRLEWRRWVGRCCFEQLSLLVVEMEPEQEPEEEHNAEEAEEEEDNTRLVGYHTVAPPCCNRQARL